MAPVNGGMSAALDADRNFAPGWTIEIDLRETLLEGRPFESKHGEIAGDLDEWREHGNWWTAEANGVRSRPRVARPTCRLLLESFESGQKATGVRSASHPARTFKGRASAST